jgi:hypothetical protein
MNEAGSYGGHQPIFRIHRVGLALFFLVYLLGTANSVKHLNNDLDFATLQDNANRNGHGLDGIGKSKEIVNQGNATKTENVAKKHVLYLKAMDTHNENGLKPYRYFEEDKQRRENSKFLYNYLQEQERIKMQKNQKELKTMLGEALKVLKKKSNEHKGKTKMLAKSSSFDQGKYLLNQLLLNLEKQSQKEASLLKSSHTTSLAKTEHLSREKAKILAWIESSYAKGDLNWDAAQSLSMFVENHDTDLGHNHVLQACPYRLLAQLAAEGQTDAISS